MIAIVAVAIIVSVVAVVSRPPAFLGPAARETIAIVVDAARTPSAPALFPVALGPSSTRRRAATNRCGDTVGLLRVEDGVG